MYIKFNICMDLNLVGIVQTQETKEMKVCVQLFYLSFGSSVFSIILPGSGLAKTINLLYFCCRGEGVLGNLYRVLNRFCHLHYINPHREGEKRKITEG